MSENWNSDWPHQVCIRNRPLIWTEQFGLRDAGSGDFIKIRPVGTYYRTVDGYWNRRVRVPDRARNQKPLNDWESVSIRNLPAELKVQALLLDIPI